MADFPLVSIIIVNYNGKTYLEKCLNSLMNVNYPKFEVILVDNNSEDDSVEFVKNNFPSVIILKLSKNYGFAEPNNMGAKITKGEFLLFLNNDTIVTPNFITELIVAALKNKQIAILQSLLLKPDNQVDSSGDFIDIYGRAYSSRKKPKEISYVLSGKGACMLINKNIFLKLEGFDKNFFASFEDVDLGWRSWIMGYYNVIVPNSIVYHLKGKTIEKLKKEIQFHGAKNTLLLRLTNFEFSFLIRGIFVLAIVTLIRRLFGYQVINDPEPSPPLPPVETVLKASWWILKNIRYVINKRRKIRLNRKVSTNDLLKLKVITS